MEQRIALITLGVRDLARSTAFFETLGWRRSVRGAEGVAFFQCGAVAFGLFPLEALAEDAHVEAAEGGSTAMSVAYNARSREEVDAVLAEAEAAGATVVKPGQDVFWGGYNGYFRDLDGHLWEVAWNPGFPIADDGSIMLPD